MRCGKWGANLTAIIRSRVHKFGIKLTIFHSSSASPSLFFSFLFSVWVADGVESTIFPLRPTFCHATDFGKKNDDVVRLLFRPPVCCFWHASTVVMDSFVERKRNSFDDVYVALAMIKIYLRVSFCKLSYSCFLFFYEKES